MGVSFIFGRTPSPPPFACPARLASLLVHRLKLMMVKPPFNLGIDEQFLFYPATAQRDRGSLRFRSLMMKISKPDRPDRPRR
jgi:hypothetical protein